MNKKLEGMIFGSFVADAFSLAPHWIYSVEQINKAFGNLDTIADVPTHSYHKTKTKGDFTHYGDQTLWLFEYLKNSKEFDVHGYKKFWMKKMKTYKGYMDHSTKESLHLLKETQANLGSHSTDLSGAAMIAPLIYFYYTDHKKLLNAVDDKIKLTHNNELVVDSGKFFAIVTVNVINGMTPIHAINFELEHNSYLGKESKLFIENSIKETEESLNEDTATVITEFGQSCSINHALKSSIYLIYKYENNYKAIVNNALAGGDSAARGMLVGMVLGAFNKFESIPVNWLHDMNYHSEILRLLR